MRCLPVDGHTGQAVSLRIRLPRGPTRPGRLGAADVQGLAAQQYRQVPAVGQRAWRHALARDPRAPARGCGASPCTGRRRRIRRRCRRAACGAAGAGGGPRCCASGSARGRRRRHLGARCRRSRASSRRGRRTRACSSPRGAWACARAQRAGAAARGAARAQAVAWAAAAVGRGRRADIQCAAAVLQRAVLAGAGAVGRGATLVGHAPDERCVVCVRMHVRVCAQGEREMGRGRGWWYTCVTLRHGPTREGREAAGGSRRCGPWQWVDWHCSTWP